MDRAFFRAAGKRLSNGFMNDLQVCKLASILYRPINNGIFHFNFSIRFLTDGFVRLLRSLAPSKSAELFSPARKPPVLRLGRTMVCVRDDRLYYRQLVFGTPN